MTLNPNKLQTNLDLLEDIEKATLRLVVQGVVDFREAAVQIFREEQDLVADIGEDITREALDRLGTSVIPVRLLGKIDYKRARYLFHPDYSIKQALFVDSKAEKTGGENTATIQTAQTSMAIRQRRRGQVVMEQGGLPKVVTRDEDHFLTTTVFVKYNYTELQNAKYELMSIAMACLPNGMLQERYNPNAEESFWLAGRNAPSRGEAFRVRIGLKQLKDRANWRVQRVPVTPAVPFRWDD